MDETYEDLDGGEELTLGPAPSERTWNLEDAGDCGVMALQDLLEG